MNKPLALLLLLLAGCGQAPATPPPLAGARIGGPFALVDGDGVTRTERDFAGRYRIMYFGYTFCPDVCPTDMQVIGQAMTRVDAAKAAKIVPIFVTIDPARDTPAVVKRFAATFHPRAVGLTGSPEAIARAQKAYVVYAKRGAATRSGGYLMDHSRQAYLMAPDGSPVALLPTEQGAAAVAAEIERWVR
jgi:protein SCO1/2